MKELRLAVIQLFSSPGDPAANAEKICSFLREAAARGAGLALLPEACLTGYPSADDEITAVSPADPAVLAVREASRKAGASVCFGYVEKTDGLPFITQEFFCRGTSTLYRKTHLGSSERGRFQAGGLFPAADLFPDADPPADGRACSGPGRRSLRCGMQLCWESHIPEISSAYRAQGAELLLFPYASGMGGETCRQNWSVHLPARASDNGVFAAACNALKQKSRGARDSRASAASEDDITGGGIAVYDPKGRLAASYFGSEERLLICDLAGPLPRELPEGDMHHISYYDRRRTDLF